MTWRVGVATGAGTCGELVQGVLSDGRSFHVTCPINKGSRVALALRESRKWRVEGVPAGRQKLERAIQLTAETLAGGPYEINVEHSSELEVGKGLGSSTADIMAGARATASALGLAMDEDRFAALAASIEVSDGSMYPEIVAFDGRAGVPIRRYHWWPQFAVVVVTPAASIDTDSVDFTGQASLSAHYDRIVADLDLAVAERDGRAFARSAGESAHLNQSFVSNPWLDVLERESERLGADGINVAHTGTCLGLLFLLPATTDARATEETDVVRRKASSAARRLRAVLPDELRVGLAETPVWRESRAGSLDVGADPLYRVPTPYI
jgi:L-threonine kinase